MRFGEVIQAFKDGHKIQHHSWIYGPNNPNYEDVWFQFIDDEMPEDDCEVKIYGCGTLRMSPMLAQMLDVYEPRSNFAAVILQLVFSDEWEIIE